MKEMGGLGNLVDELPAQLVQQAQGANMGQAEEQVRRMEGVISSTAATEHTKSELTKASRKRRVTAGASVQVQKVNRLPDQFKQVQSMMKELKGDGMMKMMCTVGDMKGDMKGLFGGR